MSRKTRFLNIAVLAIILSGCAHNEKVILCPPPPDAAMVPPGAMKPLPERDLSARDVFQFWADDIAAYQVNAARLTALQAWGRDQCGWVIPSGTSSPRQP